MGLGGRALPASMPRNMSLLAKCYFIQGAPGAQDACLMLQQPP